MNYNTKDNPKIFILNFEIQKYAEMKQDVKKAMFRKINVYISLGIQAQNLRKTKFTSDKKFLNF